MDHLHYWMKNLNPDQKLFVKNSIKAFFVMFGIGLLILMIGDIGRILLCEG